MLKRFSLSKLLPKTLWGQLVSLLMLALIISQSIALFIFVDTRRTLDNSTSEANIVGHIANVVNSLDKSKNNGRPNRQYLTASSLNGFTFRGGKESIRGKDDRPEYSARLKQLLTDRLIDKSFEIIVKSEDPSNGAQSTSKQPPKRVKISIKLTPDFWMNVEHKETEISTDWIAPLLLTMVIMMVLIVIIVSWVVRQLTKPLAALAIAAHDLGHGKQVAEIEETGALDVRRVTRSFNQMNKKVTRFVSDRTQMLAAISHDLRTPITSLRLRAEYIKDEELRNKMIPIIEEMREMTESSLQFSKDSATVEKTVNVDLTSLLETLTADYIDMSQPVELASFGNYPKTTLPLRLQSMKRALRNLIDNGLKYGKSVELDFTIKKDTKTIEIFIRDNGPGIDEKEFEQVFEPFYRIEKSRSKDTGGVGLGMSIAKGVIHAHGGEIELKNLLKGNQTTGLEVKIILPFG